jgi:transcriptional regulator with XRE-family HTH domain
MKGVTSPDVGRALRFAREKAGLQPAHVARLTGLTAVELLSIEAGRGRPSIDVLQRLARAIGANLVEVLRRGKPRDRPADERPRARAGGGRRSVGGLGVDALANAILDLPPTVGSKLDAVASAAVLRAMALCRNNQSAAARMLGMERKAFVRRLHRARRRRK